MAGWEYCCEDIKRGVERKVRVLKTKYSYNTGGVEIKVGCGKR